MIAYKNARGLNLKKTTSYCQNCPYSKKSTKTTPKQQQHDSKPVATTATKHKQHIIVK